MADSKNRGTLGAHAAQEALEPTGDPARIPASGQEEKGPGIDAAFVAAVFARIAVGAVFAANVMCAVQFIVAPTASAAGYGLATDYATQALVTGLGIAFLMWNATYPAVIANPIRFRALFAVVLVQQAIGLVGETGLRMRLVAQGMHDSLMLAGIDRFILWDAGGLLVMGVTFIVLAVALRRR